VKDGDWVGCLPKAVTLRHDPQIYTASGQFKEGWKSSKIMSHTRCVVIPWSAAAPGKSPCQRRASGLAVHAEVVFANRVLATSIMRPVSMSALPNTLPLMYSVPRSVSFLLFSSSSHFPLLTLYPRYSAASMRRSSYSAAQLFKLAPAP